jgi:hypothetical protein
MRGALEAANYDCSGQGNGFGFTFSWVPDAAVVVLSSTNLQDWTPLITNTPVTGTDRFLDTDWTKFPVRFYQVVGH